jgi:hypothetical protein
MVAFYLIRGEGVDHDYLSDLCQFSIERETTVDPRLLAIETRYPSQDSMLYVEA